MYRVGTIDIEGNMRCRNVLQTCHTIINMQMLLVVLLDMWTESNFMKSFM